MTQYHCTHATEWIERVPRRPDGMVEPKHFGV